MRIHLSIENENQKPIILPINYNHFLQAVIYNNISQELSAFLHKKGFLYGKRTFKLFTFSRIFGEYEIKQDRIYFNNSINLYISSPIERFIKELANTFLKKGFLFLGKNKLKIINLSFPQEPEISSKIKIKMLSPVTVYSTLTSLSGNKKTYYYSPFEIEFSKLIDANAKKKAYILQKRVIKSGMKVKPLKVKEVIVKYKDTIVKGWMGYFMMNGPKILLKTVYETGLGSKNSQGFGMFEVIGND
jgi:CRISPR-associated endoribonuclease Cas6